MTPSIGLDVIDRLTGGRLGVFDVMCPRCGPFRRSARNQRRQVLRVWKIEPSFATFCCARCGVHGHVLYRDGKRPDAAKFAKARADAAAADDLPQLMALYKQGAETGGFESGVRLALQKILVSPEFIFRAEFDPAGVSRERLPG
jgi:hypothetical protein